MSNYLAVATVTATLQRTLQAAVQTDMEGARITTVRPSDIGNSTPETGVNLFLYQVITNPALNNMDSTPLRSRGLPTKRQAALDLYYMFSFYGNETELEPQRLLGSVMRVLNDKRVITQDMIRAACRDSTLPFLQDSNLADQVQQLGIVPIDLSLDDLSKTWSVFLQTPYFLSVAYKVLVVMVDGDEAPARGLPVRSRTGNGVAPFFNQPQIGQIVAQGGAAEPVLVDSTLAIVGKQLKGDWGTRIRVFGIEVVPPDVTPDRVLLPLSSMPAAVLRAGVQSLQIIHPAPLSSTSYGRGKESNAAPFVLRPYLVTVEFAARSSQDDDLGAGQLHVQANLIIGAKQRVVVALNEWSADRPVSYLFDAPSRSTDSTTLSIPIKDVKLGDYLVRLMVDGAESQLQIDDNPDSPTYQWYVAPRITIR